jgi:opacity protein-like surface antigen
MTYARCASVLLLLVVAPTVLAQGASIRAGKWETTLQLVSSSSEKSSGDNGSSIDVESELGFGFGLGYNFTPNWSLGFDLLYVKPKYEAVYNSEEDGLVSLRHRMTIYSGQFNGTWNLMDGPFTPYLQLGGGWTYLDSNVASGPPVTGCWWDPLWGYVCSSYWSTYNDTSFSWGYGAGLRYELRNGMFIKGSVNRVEIDGVNGLDPSFDTIKAELGWMF